MPQLMDVIEDMNDTRRKSSEEKIEFENHMYMGDIKKCPNCETYADDFTSFCSYCGYEFKSTEGSKVVNELVEKIQEYSESFSNSKKDDDRRSLKNTLAMFLYIIAGNGFIWYGMSGAGYLSLLTGIIFTILATLVLSFHIRTTNEKLSDELITNFVIPNTKSDLLEFAILAKSQILPVNFFVWLFSTSGKRQKQVNVVWTRKLVQAKEKAKITFANDGEAMQQFKTVVKSVKSGASKKILFILLIPVIMCGFYFGSPYKNAIGIEIPAETIFSTKDVSLSGSFSEYLSINSETVELKYDKDNDEFALIFSIRANEDIEKIAKQQNLAVIEVEQFVPEHCKMNTTGSWIYLNKKNYSESKSTVLFDLLKLKKGKSIILHIPLKMNSFIPYRSKLFFSSIQNKNSLGIKFELESTVVYYEPAFLKAKEHKKKFIFK